MTTVSRPMASSRRIPLLFFVSLAILVAVVSGRLVRQQLAAAEPAAPAPVALSSATMISQLQERIQNNPDNGDAYAQLGLALLQQVRETGDASFYVQAENALDEALAHDPQQVDALIGQGILALARHDFAAGLEWGQQARALNPYRAQILGIIVDAQVELGRYEEAVASAQAMVDLRPDLTSYSRVSYVRELHGDTAGAIEAMQLAVDSGLPAAEGTLWVRVQLGNLYFNSGQLEKAENIYRQTLFFRPDYPFAQAGLARIEAARGNYETAIDLYRPLVARLPLPEFVIPLGELYQQTGQPELAEEQYGLVRAIQQLNAAAGMDVDLELALFEADHGSDPAAALAKARAAYERRPSIHAADVLAWTLYHNGEYEEAWAYSQESLRLGTRDALLHYHAAMIAEAMGDREAGREHLAEALAINPYFSVGMVKVGD